MKFSEMNIYQKVLFVVSVIEMLGALLLIGLSFGAFAAAKDPTITNVKPYHGYVLLFSGIISFITSFFGCRGAKDITKIKPAYIFTMIALVSSLISVVVALFNESGSTVNYISVLSNIVLFYCAFKLNQENNANQNNNQV